jgi:hypothetical protein
MTQIKKYYAPKASFFTWKSGGIKYLYDAIEHKIIELQLSDDTPQCTYNIRNTDDTSLVWLKKYAKKFNDWCDDLCKSEVETIIYTKYYSDYIAVRKTFKRLVDKEIYATLDTNRMYIEELPWIQRCNNGAHTYINEKYIDKPIKCYGYDYSGFYPWLLSLNKMQIPKNKGKAYIFKDIDEIDRSNQHITGSILNTQI